jgi:hypothetical protein
MARKPIELTKNGVHREGGCMEQLKQCTGEKQAHSWVPAVGRVMHYENLASDVEARSSRSWSGREGREDGV